MTGRYPGPHGITTARISPAGRPSPMIKGYAPPRRSPTVSFSENQGPVATSADARGGRALAPPMRTGAATGAQIGARRVPRAGGGSHPVTVTKKVTETHTTPHVPTIAELAMQRAQTNIDSQLAQGPSEATVTRPYEAQAGLSSGLMGAIIKMIGDAAAQRAASAATQQGDFQRQSGQSTAATGGPAEVPSSITGGIQSTAQAAQDAAAQAGIFYGQQILSGQRADLVKRQENIDKIKATLPGLTDEYGDKIRTQRATDEQLKINRAATEADVAYKNGLLDVKQKDAATKLRLGLAKLRSGDLNASETRALKLKVAGWQHDLGLTRNDVAQQRADSYDRGVTSAANARTWAQQHPTASKSTKSSARPDIVAKSFAAPILSGASFGYHWQERVDTGNKNALGGTVWRVEAREGTTPPSADFQSGTYYVKGSLKRPTGIDAGKYKRGLSSLQAANRKNGWGYSNAELIDLWRTSLGMP